MTVVANVGIAKPLITLVDQDGSSGVWVVQRGDALSTIGARLGVAWQNIAQANGLKSPYTIYPGQVLRLPSASTAPVNPIRANAAATGEGAGTNAALPVTMQTATPPGVMTMTPVQPATAPAPSWWEALIGAARDVGSAAVIANSQRQAGQPVTGPLPVPVVVAPVGGAAPGTVITGGVEAGAGINPDGSVGAGIGGRLKLPEWFLPVAVGGTLLLLVMGRDGGRR